MDKHFELSNLKKIPKFNELVNLSKFFEQIT